MAKQKRAFPQQGPTRRPAAPGPPATASPAASPPQVATAAPSDKAALDTIIKRIESERNSRVIVYWTSDIARVSDAAVLPLWDQLSAIGKTDQLDLVLSTRGGDTEIPWRMISLIREFAAHIGVLIPHRAASSGTLIALGADEIVMTPLAVLGPIDPSRTHPLLPAPSGGEPEAVSVQDMRHAMQFIREAAGGSSEMPYTPEAMAQIFTALFDKLHPLAIGAIEQSYALSKLIGTRCLGSHMDPVKDEPMIKAIVDKLCDDYKSHAYQISRAEAREIGLNAIDAPPPVEDALIDLYKLYNARPVMPPPPASPPKGGTVVQGQLAWMDSTALKFRVDGAFAVDVDGNAKPVGDAWGPY